MNENYLCEMRDTMNFISIFLYLFFIAISWWALQQVRFEIFLRQPTSPQAKLLHILVSIALGYMITRFFVDYLNISLQLAYKF